MFLVQFGKHTWVFQRHRRRKNKKCKENFEPLLEMPKFALYSKLSQRQRSCYKRLFFTATCKEFFDIESHRRPCLKSCRTETFWAWPTGYVIYSAEISHYISLIFRFLRVGYKKRSRPLPKFLDNNNMNGSVTEIALVIKVWFESEQRKKMTHVCNANILMWYYYNSCI